MTGRVLAVDIGNSSVTVGLFGEDGLETFRLDTHPLRDRAFYESALRAFTGGRRPDGSVLSSVVPSHDRVFFEVLSALSGDAPVVVSPFIDTGLVFDVSEPESIGADRIANAVAACSTMAGPLVIVDLGTATTFTVVSGDRRFLGGAIMPGIEMMCVALNSTTGKLPLVKPAAVPGPLGKDTKSSIISGVVYGTAGAVERVLEETALALGDFATVLTGGNAALIDGLLRREHLHMPELTLDGLRIIFERNRG
ncbi:MAG: type III pantothenate kinase [Nitrospirae bacterium]|nr:type III pantothenate kinase [Nitrospirota bacterium]